MKKKEEILVRANENNGSCLKQSYGGRRYSRNFFLTVNIH